MNRRLASDGAKQRAVTPHVPWPSRLAYDGSSRFTCSNATTHELGAGSSTTERLHRYQACRFRIPIPRLVSTETVRESRPYTASMKTEKEWLSLFVTQCSEKESDMNQCVQSAHPQTPTAPAVHDSTQRQRGPRATSAWHVSHVACVNSDTRRYIANCTTKEPMPSQRLIPTVNIAQQQSCLQSCWVYCSGRVCSESQLGSKSKAGKSIPKHDEVPCCGTGSIQS